MTGSSDTARRPARPARTEGDWEERFIDVDGLRTHYLEAGDGPIVVLLHAGEFGGCAELSWEYTIPALAEHYRVIAPDWLGFGLTDKVHDFVGGQRRRIIHMRRFLEEMRVGAAAFVGNSMGGALLLRAQAAPEPAWPVRALVNISGGGFVPVNDARKTLLDYDCTKESMRQILRVLFRDPRFYEDDGYVQRRWEWSVVPGAWECAAAARLRSPVSDDRGNFGIPDTTEYELISVPTMIVAGEADILKEPGYAYGIADRIPDSRVAVYDGCGHAPNIEIASRFNDDLLAFLGDVYPAK